MRSFFFFLVVFCSVSAWAGEPEHAKVTKYSRYLNATYPDTLLPRLSDADEMKRLEGYKTFLNLTDAEAEIFRHALADKDREAWKKIGAKIVGDLGSTKHPIREAAQKTLSRLGCLTKPEIETLGLTAKDDLEIRRRSERLLANFDRRFTIAMPDFQRALVNQVRNSEMVQRSVQVMKRIEAGLPQGIAAKAKTAAEEIEAARKLLDNAANRGEREEELARAALNRAINAEQALYEGAFKGAGLKRIPGGDERGFKDKEGNQYELFIYKHKVSLSPVLDINDEKAHLLLEPGKGIRETVDFDGCRGDTRLEDGQTIKEVAKRKFVRVQPSLELTPGGKANEYELSVTGHIGRNPNKIQESAHGSGHPTILDFKLLADHFEIPKLEDDYGVNFDELKKISP